MASQHVLFSETIAGMKKAFRRRAYESDSDSEVDRPGNRGNKLKKRARFVREGQLAPTGGPSSYRETVNYAGVERSIVYRNPPLLDDEGYEMNSEDDDEQIEDAELAAAELNPYANVRLERILAPLIASTDLPTHPTLSKPFLSRTLTDLVQQSSAMMRHENKSLWRVRHLWTALCGDGNWMPCETMTGPDDLALYSDEHVALHLLSLRRANGAGAASPGEANGHGPGERVDATHVGAAAPGGDGEPTGAARGDADTPMDDAPADKDGGAKASEESRGEEAAEHGKRRDGGEAAEAWSKNGGGPNDKDGGAADEPADVAMREAEAPTSNGPLDADRTGGDEAPNGCERPHQALIHAMFQAPAGAWLDRDLGLPEKEAEDVRRLLALYVQKQEEVCRGTTRLHQGLLRAERLRKDVLHWAKAEAHCGANRDMSDGEDWYDREEWGLTENLKKGQDEEEEDTTTTGKKTRNRRQ